MKILNNSCSNLVTNQSNVTIVPNNNFASLPPSNHHCQVTDRTLSIGRFNTLGLTTIDPQLSSVCGSNTLTVRGNLRVCENLLIVGSTQLHDLSANWIQYWNNSTFFNWGVHIIPESKVPFTLPMDALITNNWVTGGDGHAHEIEPVKLQNMKIIWDNGWIYPGFGGYAMNVVPGITGWSDRSSYPTDGFWQNKWPFSFGICIPIPFDGWIICDSSNQPFDDHHHFHMTGNCSNTICGTSNHSHHIHGGPASRFSWNLGKYDGVASSAFLLQLAIYIVRCNDSNPQIPELIGDVNIDKRCGYGKWGVVTTPASTVTVNAGDAIGIYIKNNTGRIHSPATFTLEVHRKF